MPIKVQEKENSSLKLIPKFEMYMEYMLKIVLIQLPRTEKFSIGTEYKTLMYDTLKNILLVDKIDMSKKLLYLKSYEKLMDAHLKCQNRKKNRENVIKFNLRKEDYIWWLYKELKNRTYVHGKYTSFYVYEPKKRKIEAARYIDRVVHRWLYDNFLEPAFLPEFIDNTYVCIPERGMHRAAKDLQQAMRKCKKQYGQYYILKMDISKYFPSIDKTILMNIIQRKIKDVKEKIEKFISENLKLKFNKKTNIFKSKQGVNFCRI